MIKQDTFHFVKVEIDVPQCEEVAAVERIKHGPEYLWLWIRLALRYANHEGVLCRKIGDQVLPVTPDDLEAEMKGGFTDVSIKDGVKTLMEASLIYINSNGFMAITGLTITGDPREPVLHMQNSNVTDVRPLSVGKDTRSAMYQRARRKRIRQAEDLLRITGPEDTLVPYSDIVRETGCAKSTVANNVRRLQLEDRVVMKGQKKYLPKQTAAYVIACIKGDPEAEEMRPDPVEEMPDRLDGLDGLDSCRPPSKTVQQPSKPDRPTVQQPSKMDSEPSSRMLENSYEISTLDGLSNENPFESLNENRNESNPLIESKEIKIKDDDYIYRAEGKTAKSDWIGLYRIGFDREPTVNEISALMDLCRRAPYGTVLDALKAASRYHAESFGYVIKCVREAVKAPSEAFSGNVFDPDRDISHIRGLIIREPGITAEEKLRITEAAERAKQYWSDGEILKALAGMSAYGLFRAEWLDYFLHRGGMTADEMEESLRRMQMNRMSDGGYDYAQTD